MAMKRFRIQDAEPGMILAQPAITSAGRVMLKEGTVLTDKLIDRLLNWFIFAVDIVENEGFATEKNLPDTDVLFEKKEPSEVQKKFYATYANLSREVGETFEQIRAAKTVPIIQMRQLAEQSYHAFPAVPGAANLIYMLTEMDDHLVHHSLNVAVIAGILGRWLNFPSQTVQELMLSALLHDVGKTQLPKEIVQKSMAELTPEETAIMHTHPLEGYRLLNHRVYQLPFSVLAGVVQHHEWADGTGYPLKLTGKQLHLFAQVILVADMYENLTSTRLLKNRLTPFAVVEGMVKDLFAKLDPAIASTFLRNIRDQFIGNIVKLNDAREAIVVYVDKDISHRPVVYTRDKQFIDLERTRNTYIAEVVSV